MQPLKWYYDRLRSMTPEEVTWRVRSELRDSVDRIRIPLGFVPHLQKGPASVREASPGFSTTRTRPGAWAHDIADPLISGWAARLRVRADAISDNRLSFFNLENVFVGNPIEWNKDHEFGKFVPLRLSQTIDYRDCREAGDAKNVWEPNRHHHLVVLGRAYRAFGNPRYSEAIWRQIDSWIDDNPFGYGMNWRSPLELGIRLINWVWAIDLGRGNAEGSSGISERVRETIWRHIREIARKQSKGSSANNHLIGEAAGIFVGAAYFPDLPDAGKRLEESHAILTREILRQTYGDGCTREQAFGYHLFVLQFLLVAAVVGQRIGMELSRTCLERIEKMLEFAADLSEGGPAPLFGDCDDGYVLDLAGGGNDVRELLSVGAVLFERPDFKSLAGEFRETVRRSSSSSGLFSS